MRTAHLDTIKLHKKLDAKRKQFGYSWRDAAKAVGVSPSTLTRLKDYKHPSAEGLMRMLSWLGEHHHAVTLWGNKT